MGRASRRKGSLNPQRLYPEVMCVSLPDRQRTSWLNKWSKQKDPINSTSISDFIDRVPEAFFVGSVHVVSPRGGIAATFWYQDTSGLPSAPTETPSRVPNDIRPGIEIFGGNEVITLCEYVATTRTFEESLECAARVARANGCMRVYFVHEDLKSSS